MRVWIINHYAVPPDRAGGARHYFLGRALVKAGHEVCVVASSFDHKAGRETRFEEEDGRTHIDEMYDGVCYRWLRTRAYAGNGLSRIRNMLGFAAQIRSGRGLRGLARPDVVVGSSPHLWASSAAYRRARRLGVPFVLEVRDLWPQSLIDLGGISPLHPMMLWLAWMERRLYHGADRIVSLLPGAAAHMVEKGANPAKITWIPNGVDLDFVHRHAATTGTSDPNYFTVVYAGMHGLANGLESILDAAALLRGDNSGSRVRLRLVGDGPEKPRLQAVARERGLDNVRFEPPVPKHEVYNMLRGADALVVNMHDKELYRFGISFNKLFDYLAAGRPIVFGCSASNNPVADADAGFSVPANDAAAMAAAIARLARMPATERAAMGARGQAYVREHHDFNVLGHRLEEVLRDAIAL